MIRRLKAVNMCYGLEEAAQDQAGVLSALSRQVDEPLPFQAGFVVPGVVVCRSWS